MEEVERPPPAQSAGDQDALPEAHCLKRLGERVMARTFERQVAGLHVRVTLLNTVSRNSGARPRCPWRL